MKLTDNNRKNYINSRGETVRRVTSVIKTLSKDQLLYWANRIGLQGISYSKELTRTSNIGSFCHSVIEQYVRKDCIAAFDFMEFHIESQHDRREAMNALNSFEKWLKKFKNSHTFHVKFTEKVVVGENLGGTIDCGIDGWKDPDKVILVDYKTSSGFYFTQFLQLSAYVMLYEEVYGENTVEGIMVVRLDKKGKPGEARFIARKHLDEFILCFQCLYDVTIGVETLNRRFSDITQYV